MLGRGLLAALGGASGCATQSPLPPGAFIREPTLLPVLGPPPPPADLPTPPAPEPPAGPRPRPDPAAPLTLREVLTGVQDHFPLLYAIEQEREIAAGQRLTAEGQFDPVLRVRGSDQNGTFSNGRLDAAVEQPIPFGGLGAFAGYRRGLGNFPVYNGGLKTAEGGEFRAGLTVPLLRDRAIDPRRARLRAAQITEQLADPVVRRARLDFLRNAAQAYWAWETAGGQYQVARYLLELARDRQRAIDVQFKAGAVPEQVDALNRRLIASREEAALAADRNLQQAALRLSLFLRIGSADPVVPPADWLLPRFIDAEPPAPDPARLRADVEAALAARPELVRFQLEKERRAVELQLARNQATPGLNVFANAAQDVGFSKKTFTGEGIFRTDRTVAEVGATLDVPYPFRTARGLARTAEGQLAQLLGQERYARDEITAQVQDAVSELVLTYQRLDRAREELRQANRVLRFETVRFQKEQANLVELNLQEIAAAEARVRVVTLLGAYLGAVANYRAVLGIDTPDPGVGGRVLPKTEPLTPPPDALPPPRPLP
ncbi:MAG: hypothetical protein C0501_23430 [Isosphaera sp.]|nr:hypothetical protein [Isosphaera sp.]